MAFDYIMKGYLCDESLSVLENLTLASVVAIVFDWVWESEFLVRLLVHF